MSRRSRERKVRTLEQKQANQLEMRARELERLAPIRQTTRRLLYTGIGTLVVVLVLLGAVTGGKYLASGQATKVMGPFGEISKTELSESRHVTMKTNKGEIELELDVKNTPKTAANFVLLAKQGFFDGIFFHRIIEGFMIQGGDPNTKDDDPNNDGMGGPGYQFDSEKVVGEYTRGVIAMANSGVDTNGSQFFIMHQDNDLPKNYVIFGRVVSGMEVVDDIADTPVTLNATGEESAPTEEIIIESVTINS